MEKPVPQAFCGWDESVQFFVSASKGGLGRSPNVPWPARMFQVATLTVRRGCACPAATAAAATPIATIIAQDFHIMGRRNAAPAWTSHGRTGCRKDTP